MQLSSLLSTCSTLGSTYKYTSLSGPMFEGRDVYKLKKPLTLFLQIQLMNPRCVYICDGSAFSSEDKLKDVARLRDRSQYKKKKLLPGRHRNQIRI